ncbi:MAG: hypothetical protein E7391_07365 [Ruminococcaceae bacterium]|nr:hypothetical protein [Oscillospiraceae bacterium]
MIDFHTHILPGLDDGAESIQISLEMLQMELSQGVNTVVATPHFSFDKISVDDFLELRDNSYNTIKTYAQEKNVPVPEIILGAEVKLSPHISKRDSLEKLCIGSTNIILLEMPYHNWHESWVFDEIFAIIVSKKLIPVIAHVDRYIEKKKDFDKFQKLFRMDLNLQIDLDRYPSRHSKKIIDKLIKEELVHIVASDCHDTGSRAPMLKEKLDLIRKKHGIKVVNSFMENAVVLLNSQK